MHCLARCRRSLPSVHRGDNPLASRIILRGILGAAALLAIGAGALAVTGNMPLAAETARSAFHTASTTQEANPVQMAQASDGKGARSGSATVPGATQTTRTFGGWTVSCNEGGEPVKKVCSANFRVINQQNKANILVWLVGFNAEGQLLTEFLTLTDVLIKPGVLIQLEDQEAVRADFVECSTRGCKARLALDDSLLEQLRQSTKATIAVTRLDGQVIQFQMEIPGVDQALSELGV